MRIAERILEYASKRVESFHRRDLMNELAAADVPVASAQMQLNRLVASGRLSRTGYGVYVLSANVKMDYHYHPTGEEVELSRLIRDKFPFADFCVWKPSALVQFMQHIPALNIVLVDVERVAMESVFHFMQSQQQYRPVLLAPSRQECDRYITTERIFIVRPLISESPLEDIDGVRVPTLEKMLVDAAGDKELTFAQGAELYTIYNNAHATYNIGKSRLMRYASRRNRKQLMLKILKTITPPQS